jgi:hypothetical protein
MKAKVIISAFALAFLSASAICAALAGKLSS